MRASAGSLSRHMATAALLAPSLVFVGLCFIVPMVDFFLLGFRGENGVFGTYLAVLGSDAYRHVFLKTILLGAVVTAISVLLALPVAWLLTNVRGNARMFVSWCVLFPLWISILVRTFSWMLLLDGSGPLNRLAQYLSGSATPLRLLFSDFAVALGMIHVLVPFAIFPLATAMARVDRTVLAASEGLGASPLYTFRKVYAPLIAPGIGAAATLVFLLSLGFFITPALLGGQGGTTVPMLIEQLINEQLNWQMASAVSFILLGLTLVILAATLRVFPVAESWTSR
ncbi:MAG: ABC transporter permease [Mesorhizobium sp.]